MKHVISLELDELDAIFIEKLKKLYENSKADLTIVLEQEDETDFLLKSEANRQRLMKSIESDRKGDVVTPNLEQFSTVTHA